MNKNYIFGILLIGLLLTASAYFILFKNNEIAGESTEPQFVTQACTLDTDCALFQPDCEDCEFAAINKNQVDQYQRQKDQMCEANPAQYMCDIVFTGEVKCISNSCTIIAE